MPGQFILVNSERFASQTTARRCCCRSSAARAGFEHSFQAGVIRALTGSSLWNTNNLQHRPLWIAPRLRICQLVVYRLTSHAIALMESVALPKPKGRNAQHKPIFTQEAL